MAIARLGAALGGRLAVARHRKTFASGCPPVVVGGFPAAYTSNMYAYERAADSSRAKTFDKIDPIAQQVGDLFYTRLFEIDPSLRALFKGDMKKQALMLMTVIGLAVRGLDRPEALLRPCAHWASGIIATASRRPITTPSAQRCSGP
jgi:hypothetical protein